ncbi:uncharacterized protein TM35_000051330 [Trypanosoma theileri]|uniref:Transmembrane protein n=1 Tax=Trypanosoma theileri TaxID=67003 RepID=A0A1X0P3P0_9TRYP|nr:uncharacterized protein TM35_000051330 [Trypanosoma theileri]ORC91537.1 hypothetical protein TM35_000051330 [Trypanosoma theileri]
MFDTQSTGGSSLVSVHPEYLDGQTPRRSTNEPTMATEASPTFLTARSLLTQGHTVNNSFESHDEYNNANINVQNSDNRTSRAWNAVRNRAADVVRRATKGANNLIERLLEPHGTDSNNTNNAGDGRNGTLSLQLVCMNGTNPTYSNPALLTNFDEDAFNGDPSADPNNEKEDYVEEEEEEEEEDLEPLRVEIDLPSTLRAYRKNPNECFGHLVGAALSSRSPEDPVTGVELREARRNPYLVRMVIDSNLLDLNDELVHSEVQRCVDSLIPPEVQRVPQGVYEYLPSLFKLPFVRLNSKQYEVLKDSGFEFVTLLCEYPHILPPGRFNSIRLNYVNRSWYIDLFLMLVNIFTEIFCITSIVLVTVHYMMVDGGEYQSYGYYTVTMYGVGYAANLIGMIFLMRGKERDTVYGKMLCGFPSPHLHVVPVVPLYNIVSFITYLRYRMAKRRGGHIAVIHDILIAQILSSLCFALCLAMPQFIFQRYINAADVYIPVRIGHNYSFVLLYIAVISTCFIVLLRMLRVFLTYDSINCFGFACFGFHGDRIIERHSAILRMVYLCCLFVFELNVFFLVLGSMGVSDCAGKAVVTIVISGISTFLLVLVFGFLLLWHETVFRIMWSLIPLTLLQIALLAYKSTVSAGTCELITVAKGSWLLFPDIIWALLFFFLLLLLIQGIYVFVKGRMLRKSN